MDLEHFITCTSFVPPSQRMLNLHPSVFWITKLDQMTLLSTLSSIMIQGGVGREEKELCLSDLRSLTSLEVGSYGFCNCNTVVLKSMNDWMNDEWDLTRLKSIILGYFAFEAEKDDADIESSSLIMNSMNDSSLLSRSSFSVYSSRKWIQFQISSKSEHIW